VSASIYLVRHGETAWNRLGILQGHAGAGLNRAGREQAQRLAAFFRGCRVDAVITSPLRRAVQTARLIARETRSGAPTVERLLIERSYGIAEGRKRDDIIAAFGSLDDPRVGAEPLPALRERAVKVLASLSETCTQRGSSIVAVTHSAVIRALVNSVQAGAIPPDQPIENASIHSLHRSGEGDRWSYSPGGSSC